MQYKLPGTKFVQTNDESDIGNCLFTAIGNALLSRRDDDELMGSPSAISDIVKRKKKHATSRSIYTIVLLMLSIKLVSRKSLKPTLDCGKAEI